MMYWNKKFGYCPLRFVGYGQNPRNGFFEQLFIIENKLVEEVVSTNFLGFQKKRFRYLENPVSEEKMREVALSTMKQERYRDEYVHLYIKQQNWHDGTGYYDARIVWENGKWDSSFRYEDQFFKDRANDYADD